MAETLVVTEDQIGDFIKWLIELTPTLYVDEKGYPHQKETGEPIYAKASTKDSKVLRPIILYGSVIADNEAVILNPFIEGMNQTPEREWFYSILTITAGHYVRMIQKSLIMAAIESKDKKKEDKGDIELAGILAPWVDKVDETTLKEFNQLTTKLSDYFNIYYMSKRREARIYCGLFDPDFRAAHKKVRAKTWEVLEKMMQQIFDTKDFTDFVVVSKMQGCPQLDATLKILLKVYTMLNRYMKYLPAEVQAEMKFEEVDLDYLSRSIDQLEFFRSKAKYLVPGAGSPNNKPTVGNNPINNLQPTVGLPGMNITPNTQFCLPGQTNFGMGNVGLPGISTFGQPQLNIGLSIQPMGFAPAGSPQQPSTGSVVNTGPFGR